HRELRLPPLRMRSPLRHAPETLRAAAPRPRRRRSFVLDPPQQLPQRFRDLALVDVRFAETEVDAKRERFVLHLPGEVLRATRFLRLGLRRLLADIVTSQLAGAEPAHDILHRL